MIPFAGKDQLSIAWPDGPATRHTEEEATRLGIEELGADGAGQEVAKLQGSLEVELGRLQEMLNENVDTILNLQDSVKVKESEIESLRKQLDEATAATDVQPIDTVTSEPVDAQPGEPSEPESETSEAQAIRDYLAQHPDARNVDVVKALAEQGVKIASSQVSRQKKNLAENA